MKVPNTIPGIVPSFLRERYFSIIEHYPDAIPVGDGLPDDGQAVFIYVVNSHTEGRWHDAKFRRGKVPNGNQSICFEDQAFNNLRPYGWEAQAGPMRWFGQDVTHWLPMFKKPE